MQFTTLLQNSSICLGSYFAKDEFFYVVWGTDKNGNFT